MTLYLHFKTTLRRSQFKFIHYFYWEEGFNIYVKPKHYVIENNIIIALHISLYIWDRTQYSRSYYLWNFPTAVQQRNHHQNIYSHQICIFINCMVIHETSNKQDDGATDESTKSNWFHKNVTFKTLWKMIQALCMM